jgi:hypothetical protein
MCVCACARAIEQREYGVEGGDGEGKVCATFHK